MSGLKRVAKPIPVRPWAHSRHRMALQNSLARKGSVRNGKTSNVSTIARFHSTSVDLRRGPIAAITCQTIDIGVEVEENQRSQNSKKATWRTFARMSLN